MKLVNLDDAIAAAIGTYGDYTAQVTMCAVYVVIIMWETFEEMLSSTTVYQSHFDKSNPRALQ